ncbi:MAG: protein kinase [Myxococcales bacterium]
MVTDRANDGPLALAPTSLSCPPKARGSASEAMQTVQVGTARSKKEAPSARLDIGTVIGGRYELVEFVAEGAFGAVYRAHDVDVPGHVVALKVMHRPAASEAEHARFLREVQLIAAVSHPSVVSFKDHGLHRGRLYIVMPWYEGETLAQRLKTRGALTRQEAAAIFKRLAAALSAMHERGIRHQDVKPENILLARFGEGQEDHPVLLDLGVGAFNDEHLPAFTAHYVAPEMARAHLALCSGEKPSPVDGKADVFALALTLVDSLAPDGRELNPEAASQGALAQRAEVGVALPPLRELSDIQQALARWLSVVPAQRPSARELTNELAVLTRREERQRERRRLFLRVGPVLCLVGALAMALAFQLRTERVRSRVKDARIEQQAAEIDSARDAIDALNGEQRSRAQEVEATRQENGLLEAKLSREQARKLATEKALETEQRSARELKRALESGNERTLQLEGELRGLDQELAQLRNERENIGEELLRAQSHRRSLNAEAERGRQEQIRLQYELQGLQAERSTLVERIRELERSESALSAELARAREQLRDRPRREARMLELQEGRPAVPEDTLL